MIMISERKSSSVSIDEQHNEKRLSVNFHMNWRGGHSHARDTDKLIGSKWWRIGTTCREHPLSQFNIQKAIASAGMIKKEIEILNAIVGMKAKLIQAELLAELNEYIETDKKSDAPIKQKVKKWLARHHKIETDSSETKEDATLQEYFWSWQTEAPDKFNQVKQLILSIEDFDSAFKAYEQINNLIGTGKNKRLSARILKVRDKLYGHIGSLSSLVNHEFQDWVHSQIKKHYVKVYEGLDAMYKEFCRPNFYSFSRNVALPYPMITSRSEALDRELNKHVIGVTIIIPWKQADIAFIESLGQRMQAEARDIVQEILHKMTLAAGLPEVPEQPVDVVPEIEVPPALLAVREQQAVVVPSAPPEKKEDAVKIEAAVNRNPIRLHANVVKPAPKAPVEQVIDEEDQPGLELQPGAPDFEKLQSPTFFKAAVKVVVEAEGQAKKRNAKLVMA